MVQIEMEMFIFNGTLLKVLESTTNNWSQNQIWNMATSSTAYAYAIGGNAFGHSEGNSYEFMVIWQKFIG